MLPTAKPLGMFVGWALDLITSLPETEEGEKYLILAIDCYSKWVECGALTNCESQTIAQWFYTNVLARYGKCAFVRTDQGSEFKGLFSELLQ